jgi:hypothetical protein
MPETTVNIFISAVSDEFASYRKALVKFVDRKGVRIEEQDGFIQNGFPILTLLNDNVCIPRDSPQAFSKSPSNRCRLERAFRPRTPTASMSTRNPHMTKPFGPSYRSPSSVAMVALSTLRLFDHARGFYVTASAQAECYHSTYLSSKSMG